MVINDFGTRAGFPLRVVKQKNIDYMLYTL